MSQLVHVTEVLSIINQGYGHVRPSVLERARRIGREFHRQALGWVLGHYIPETNEYEINKIVRDMLSRFQEWFGLAVSDVLFVEQEIEDPALMLVGRPDIPLMLKGEEFWRMTDLKSVALLSPVTGLQLAAYEYLAAKKYGIKKWGPRSALQTKRDGGHPYLKEYRNPADWDAFLHVYSLYNHLRR